MLQLHTTREDTRLTIELNGRLDTVSAPQLEEELKKHLDDINELILIFDQLVYISSAGLRVLLMAQKTMNKQGSMRLRGVSDEVMEVFEITGFQDILTIE